MYTDCPGCHRQFVVRAVHLAAAGGQVRCGFCGRQFNALEGLRDFPAAGTPHGAAAPVESEPQFELPASGPEKPRPAPAPTRRTPAIPPALLGDALETPRPRRVAPAILCVLLVLAGTLQAAWFNRDVLLEHYPQLVPGAERLCAYLGCEIMGHRDLSTIKLLDRDVRLHPRYEHSLLVNATIANESRTPQPFPRIQLLLYDTSGRAVAYRAFAPAEYLDGSVNPQRGMTPGKPVHLVLELTGNAGNAVSFEFGFL